MRLIAISLLALAVSPVSASGTVCMFYAPPDAPVPDLEFMGREKFGGILVLGQGGPRQLPSSTYELLQFDERVKRIHLVYTNPNDPSLPPSFALEGEGQQARLTVLGETYTGQFECGQW